MHREIEKDISHRIYRRKPPPTILQNNRNTMNEEVDHGTSWGRGDEKAPDEISDDARGDALQMMLQALAYMQEAMKTMEMKMDKTDETVGFLAHSMCKLERKYEELAAEIHTVEQTTSGELERVREYEAIGGRNGMESHKLLDSPEVPHVSNISATCTKRPDTPNSGRNLSTTYTSLDIQKSPDVSSCSECRTGGKEMHCRWANETQTENAQLLLDQCSPSEPSQMMLLNEQRIPITITFPLSQTVAELERSPPPSQPPPSSTSTISKSNVSSSSSSTTASSTAIFSASSGYLHHAPGSRSVPSTPSPPTAAKHRVTLGRNLMTAAQSGSTKHIQKLLDEGADVNFSNRSMMTPLHMAAMKAQTGAVALLLERDADPNARTAYGFTALHMAAHNDRSGLCVSLLVYAGCDVNSRNQFGRTPLHYAADCGNEPAVRALVGAGASKTAKDDEGRTAYHVAKTNAVRQLISPPPPPPPPAPLSAPRSRGRKTRASADRPFRLLPNGRQSGSGCLLPQVLHLIGQPKPSPPPPPPPAPGSCSRTSRMRSLVQKQLQPSQ